jgi:AcrR family transcriptional regulator
MTLDDISRGIDGTKGTIYYFFKSKGDMLYKMNLYGFELLEQAVNPIFSDGSLPPVERLEKVVRAHTLVACRHWQLWRAILNEVTVRETSPGGLRALGRKGKKYEKDVAQLVEAVTQAEGWKQVDSDLVTRFIFGVINSIARWYRDGGKYTAEDMADYAVQCVFEGGFQRRRHRAPVRQ